MPLTLRFHEVELAVCRLEPSAPVPVSALAEPFAAFLRTHNEATLVCPAHIAPHSSKTELGWMALELVGQFDFALTGILTQVTIPLAEAGIPIFALSSFDTDYVLIKADKRLLAEAALVKAGHKFI